MESYCFVANHISFYYYFFTFGILKNLLAEPLGVWGLSSPARDRTPAL